MPKPYDSAKNTIEYRVFNLFINMLINRIINMWNPVELKRKAMPKEKSGFSTAEYRELKERLFSVNSVITNIVLEK